MSSLKKGYESFVLCGDSRICHLMINRSVPCSVCRRPRRRGDRSAQQSTTATHVPCGPSAWGHPAHLPLTHGLPPFPEVPECSGLRWPNAACRHCGDEALDGLEHNRPGLHLGLDAFIVHHLGHQLATERLHRSVVVSVDRTDPARPDAGGSQHCVVPCAGVTHAPDRVVQQGRRRRLG